MKARGNRSRIVIITKVGSPMGKGKEGLSARYIAEAVEASLKRLQIETIDLYLRTGRTWRRRSRRRSAPISA